MAAIQLALIEGVPEKTQGLKPGVRSFRNALENQAVLDNLRARNSELRVEVVILEEALQSITEERPLRSAVSGKARCRTYPHCDHPGCESFKHVQDMALKALLEVSVAREKLKQEAKARTTKRGSAKARRRS